MQSLDIAGPWEVLTGANRHQAARGEQPAYDLRLAGAEAEVASESGLIMVAEALGEPVRAGTLVVPRRTAAGEDGHADLVDWLRECRPTRLLSICSGAFLCARAGLLSGRRVATHWSVSRDLGRRFPDLTVDHDALYVHDGPAWTSGGVTAGIDLALAVVAADHGARVAQEIARWLVMFLHRPGQQAQFSGPAWLERASEKRVAAVQRALEADPTATHRVDDLAAQLAADQADRVAKMLDDLGLQSVVALGHPSGGYVIRRGISARGCGHSEGRSPSVLAACHGDVLLSDIPQRYEYDSEVYRSAPRVLTLSRDLALTAPT
ncbi:AraC family transcriptional regulator [Micromonospora arborensis]|uniref:GlxA family transcriptional regulator n=1 Tax=Micromonospora arborensis TaxID=2116518 RepID=UPI003444B604